jgi:sulfate adenylyltransferase
MITPVILAGGAGTRLYPLEMEKEALAIYGTTDRKHPGVAYLYEKSGRYYIGGSIEALNLPIHSDFKQIRRSPQEVRSVFARLGWKRVVGFQTHQPLQVPKERETVSLSGTEKGCTPRQGQDF